MLVCGNKFKPLLGDAFPAININPNESGERAEAKITFLQEIVRKPVEYYKTAWDILLKTATGYQWIELGKKTAPVIKEELKNNPQLDNALTTAFSMAKGVGEYIGDTAGPYLWLAKNGPYVAGVLAVVLIYFVFTNPGAVKPEKVSLF